jgi:hypothetical protein
MYGRSLRRIRARLLLLPLVAGFLSFIALPALANPLPVAIDPTRLEFTASPGGHITGTFNLWNGTDAFLPVHVESVDLAQQDEEGHATVEGENAANSLKAWVTPLIPDLSVAPKQEIALQFSIDVPANADPGSHWGAILAITAPVAGGGGAAAVQVRTGTILLVRVLGDAKEKLTLDSFTVPRFAESPPIALEARFKNEGTVHEAPSGDIEVRNMFGWIVATCTLPVRNVLPGSIRRSEISVGDGLWLGRYTVSLRATYGDAGQKLAAEKIIWVLPWRTQGWKVLLGIGVLAFVIWKRRNFGRAWYALRTGKPPPADY